MKRTALQLTGLAIGLFAVLAFFYLFKSLSALGARNAKSNRVVGEIESVEGQVEMRKAGSVRFEAVPSERPIENQDLLVTQNASHADVELKASGTAQLKLRLEENSKLIIERDPDHPGGLMGTLLGGTINVIERGQGSSTFRLFRQGREITLSKAASSDVLLLPKSVETGTQVTAGSPRSVGDDHLGLVITATREADRSAPGVVEPTSPTSGNEDSGTDLAASMDVLSNEDIVRHLRRQSGYFQRCFLSYLDRTELKNQATGETGGVVTMSFTITSSGKVTDAKVIKSDFKDSTVNNCVTEVTERTNFRGYRGRPVPVEAFPISLQ